MGRALSPLAILVTVALGALVAMSAFPVVLAVAAVVVLWTTAALGTPFERHTGGR